MGAENSLLGFFAPRLWVADAGYRHAPRAIIGESLELGVFRASSVQV
jgi:hypothetical protein